MEFKIEDVSEYERKELEKVLKEPSWRWVNFKNGDVVYIESVSELPLPNLTFKGTKGNVITLKRK